MATLNDWRQRRIVVFGDVILDRYVYGNVGRISPEAPVPVVLIESEQVRLGGAANVALNVLALEASPRVVSLIGDDEAGQQLRQELDTQGVDQQGLITAAGRPTPQKTRVLARHQQVVRLDREDDSVVDSGLAERLVEAGLKALEGADGLVVSDYAKGTLDRRTVPPILEAARERGIPSVVDPKIRHFELFSPASVITPNQAEAAQASAREIRSDEDVLAAAKEILARLQVDSVLVTRGEEGMLLATRGGEPEFVRAHAREVFDVTGAGDTVAAVLGVALAGGWGLARAARIANAAASLAVGRLGTAAVGLDEIREISVEGV